MYHAVDDYIEYVVHRVIVASLATCEADAGDVDL